MVCTPTRTVAEQVREAYGPLAREIRVTPLGVTPEWFAARPPSAADAQRLGLPGRYLLFVGTREPRKDLATLLAAHTRLRRRDPDSPDLVLVGPTGWGPDQPPVAGVHILGYLSQEQLTAVVAGAQALVLPSRDEGFGLPALEALATGVPVVVSDIPVLVEVTGGLAATFPVGDVEALADVLADVLACTPPDGGGAAERERRREHAGRFSWAATARATVDAYRAAVG